MWKTKLMQTALRSWQYFMIFYTHPTQNWLYLFCTGRFLPIILAGVLCWHQQEPSSNTFVFILILFIELGCLPLKEIVVSEKFKWFLSIIHSQRRLRKALIWQHDYFAWKKQGVFLTQSDRRKLRLIWVLMKNRVWLNINPYCRRETSQSNLQSYHYLPWEVQALSGCTACFEICPVRAPRVLHNFMQSRRSQGTNVRCSSLACCYLSAEEYWYGTRATAWLSVNLREQACTDSWWFVTSTQQGWKTWW